MGESAFSLTGQTIIYCAHFILTCVSSPPYWSLKMKKMDFYDKLMKFEEYKYSMYLMLKEKPMCIPDILDFFPLTRSATQNMIEAFVVKGHLTFFIDINPKTGRKLKFYKYAGIEYTKKTRDDFIDFFVRNGTSKEEVKETKKPDWYNPHATVYKLLDKRRESAPRPKSKNIYGNIGSSFSMMEFA